MSTDTTDGAAVAAGGRLKEITEPTRTAKTAIAGLACGVLGVFAAVWIYWLVVPGVVLGVSAIALGWKARRRNDRERGNVAIALGIVAVLLVPATLVVAEDAEQWGRDCAMDPTHDPNC